METKNGWITEMSGGGFRDVPVIFLPPRKRLVAIRCLYCDAMVYSPVEEAAEIAVKQHIAQCELHPLADANRRIKALELELDAVRSESIAKDRKPKKK